MKKSFLLLLLVGVLAGCETPLESAKYTTWRGGVVPTESYYEEGAYREFQKIVNLVEDNKDKEIDDEDFVEKLSTKTFYAPNRYFHLKDWFNGGSNWSWVYDWVGGVMTSKLYFEPDGRMFERHYIEHWESSCGPAEVDALLEYYAQYNCVGYYITCEWSYDAETHTLKTKRADADVEKDAEVLYYDGTTAILLGAVAPLGHSDKGIFIEELYQVEFPDKEAGYLEGLLPMDEFYVLREEYNTAQE